MRIDAVCGYQGKRICISIDDDLLQAYSKFSKRCLDLLLPIFKRKISRGEIKNSNEARLFIYSEMMKPSAFKCFAGAVPDQVDIEDI